MAVEESEEDEEGISAAETETANTTTTTPLKVAMSKEDRYNEAKKKRMEFVGKAKAVDNGKGRYAHTYHPGGSDGKSFEAKSGLPDRSKPFLVLGIESSCDDTGGEMLKDILPHRLDRGLWLSRILFHFRLS